MDSVVKQSGIVGRGGISGGCCNSTVSLTLNLAALSSCATESRFVVIISGLGLNLSSNSLTMDHLDDQG